jgi:hypothetical protein
MARTIGTVLKMKDQFTGPAKKASNSTKSLQRTIKKAKNDMKKMGQSAKDNFKLVVKSATNASKKVAKLGFGAAKAGIGVGIGAGIGAVALAGKAGLGEAMNMEGYKTQLETAVKDTQKAGKLMANAVNFANKTPFETGQVVEATSVMEMYGLSSERWLADIADMAGATNKDILQATEAMADASMGEWERLKEFGIRKEQIVAKAAEKYGAETVFNKKGQMLDEVKAMEVVQELMQEKYKGGAEKLAKTGKGLWSTITGVTKSSLANIVGMQEDGTIRQGSMYEKLKSKISLAAETLQKWQQDGTIDRIRAQVESAMEKAGNAIAFARDLITNMIKTTREKFQEWEADGTIDKIREGIKKAVEVSKAVFEELKIVVKEVKDGLKATIDFVVNNWGTIAPLIMTAVGAMIAYKAAMVGAKVYKGITVAMTAYKTITQTQTIAQWALNTALNANPIGLVIAAIAAIIAIGILLVKNWDTIKETLGLLWGKFTEFFTNITTKADEAYNALWEKFAGKFPLIAEFIGNQIEAVKLVFKGILDFVVGVFTGDWAKAWGGIKDVFAGIFKGLANYVLTPIKLIRKGINFVIDKVNGMSFEVPDWVPGIGGETLGLNIPQLPELPEFKYGGIANRPSIFGEAGREMAIPLDGSQRSKSLLDMANQMIGKESKTEIHIHGDIYGFNDFKEKVAQAFVEAHNETVPNMG